MYRLFLALRYLRSRLVNLISVGGVMAGVAVLIIVVSIMDGFQERVRKHLRGSLSHLILTPTAPAEETPSFARLSELLKQNEPRVVAAAPQIRYPVFYEYKTQRQVALDSGGFTWHQMQAVGVDWPREALVSDMDEALLACRDPARPFYVSRAIEDMRQMTVLVSRSFAEKFSLTPFEEGQPVFPWGAMRTREGERISDPALLGERAEALIGQELTLYVPAARRDEEGNPTLEPQKRIAVISGVYDSGNALEDLKSVYVDLPDAREMLATRMDESKNPPVALPKHEYLQVNVLLDDFEYADVVRDRLLAGIGDIFIVETWEDQKVDMLMAVEQEKVMLVIVLSFIVLLGGFIILATLTLTVVEKTRDIGIVGALGAGRIGILSIFLMNGLLIGIFGALLGLGLGYWFVQNVDAVHAFIKDVTGRDVFPPNIYQFRTIPTVWHWPSVLTIMGGSVLVAFLAGLLPAMRAARLDPIKALRYE